MKTVLLGKYYYCYYVMGLGRSSDLSKVIQQICNGGMLDSKSGNLALELTFSDTT